MLNVGLR